MSAAVRFAYRVAHRLRDRWRRLRKVELAGASMIACDIEGKILMIRLSYAGGLWSLPGGGANRGESFEAAAVRELAEETGCMAFAVRKLGEIAETISGSPHTAHIFACNIQDTPRADGREVVEARLFPPHSLPHPRSELTDARLDLWRQSLQAVTAG